MTRSIRSKTSAGVERFAPVLLAGMLAFALAGCKTTQPTEPTASLGVAAAGAGADRPSALAWAERYRANPADPEAVVNYARALRAYGQRAQAVAVLEQASIQHPKNHGVLAAYGCALAEAGNYKRALDVLNHAHTPADPDWRIISVCPMRFPRTWCGRRRRCAGRRGSRASMRECSKTSRWSWVCSNTPRTCRAPCESIRQRPKPTSPICGRCWRGKTAGKRRPIRSGPWSRRREADRGVAVGGPGNGRISDRWRFGGGRAAGGDETEGGDQCGEQGGADQRRVPHVWSPAENGTRPLRRCMGISAAKGQKMVNAAYPNQVNNR